MTRKKSWFIPLLLILGFDLVILEPVLVLLGNFLINQDTLQRSDLIAVVSGPGYRTQYAVELYKQGWADHLFFTGGVCDEHPPTDALWSERKALENGIPLNSISMDDTNILSTYQEAQRLKIYLSERPDIKSVILVTDLYHTRRAKWTYQKVLGNQVKLIVRGVPFQETDYSAKWWNYASSRSLVAQEYIKLPFYLLRYQITTGIIQKWLSVFDYL